MPDPQQPDYDALAKAHGGVDYDAIASQVETGAAPVTAPEKQDDSALGAIGRGLSSFWEQVNPIAAVESAGNAILHPVATTQGVGQAQGKLYYEAADAFKKGDYVTGARKAVNYLLPLIGPALDAQSEKGVKGDIAGMVGGSVGLGTALVAPELAKNANLPTMPKVADALNRAAESKFVSTIAPKVGPQKLRFNSMAAKVAPEALRDPELGAFSRQAMQRKVATKLEEAEAGIDAANAARNTALRYDRDLVMHDLQGKLHSLETQNGVIPAPDKARAALIQQAIDELKQQGPQLSYDAMRRMRQSYDPLARSKYAPVAADYVTAQNQAAGAADVTGVLRNHMAKFDPAGAAANAPYHLYRTLNDVLQATEEAERSRPTKGRAIASRIAASVAGEGAAGVPGAVVGWLSGPVIDAALDAGVTTKISTARMMADLADALKTGQQAKIQPLLFRLASLTRTTPALRAALGASSGMAPVTAESAPTTTP